MVLKRLKMGWLIKTTDKKNLKKPDKYFTLYSG